MYCVRCGKETGDDQEYCERCGREMVSDRVMDEEPVIDPGEENLTRCYACKREIRSGLGACPYCGSKQPTYQSS